MPRRVYWGGKSLTVHLYENCGAIRRPSIWCRPQYLDWDRVKLCGQCTNTRWRSLGQPVDTK